MSESPQPPATNRTPLALIAVLIAGYVVAAVLGFPQHGAAVIVAGNQTPAAAHEVIQDHPPYWMVAPFALLLGAIALLPLIPATNHWWESNLHRFYVAGGLAAVTLIYYALLHAAPIQAHWPTSHLAAPAPSGANLLLTGEVLANAILGEYVPFIILLFSLYTISGGIRIEGDLPAHPVTNSVFLAAGAALASFIGTTGAAMLLIRPLLETNRDRKHVQHTVIFFIFIVCNCGGLLLPLGRSAAVPRLPDGRAVPLDGRSLEGVAVHQWSAVGHLPGLGLPLVLSARAKNRRRPRRSPRASPAFRRPLAQCLPARRRDPLGRIARSQPSRSQAPIGTLGFICARPCNWGWSGCPFRSAADHSLRRMNRFNYAAIIEVAVAVLRHLHLHAAGAPNPQRRRAQSRPDRPVALLLGLRQPLLGTRQRADLRGILRNGQGADRKGLGLSPAVAGVAEGLLVAVSLGSVFMGANTYIGNGPNFMVKAIAEQSGVKMPSFFGYMLYSAGILIPLFILVTVLFL